MKRATSGLPIAVDMLIDFNPRPREEGDRSFQSAFRPGAYFNPRPREEGDLLFNTRGFDMKISIHALVKRATKYIIHKDYKLFISIHALVKRATRT